MGYGYRLFSRDNLIPATATNPKGTQLALAEMDPDPLNVSGGHRNVWVEGSLDARREWIEYYGPAHVVNRMDSWDARSNDKGRISSFPPPTSADQATVTTSRGIPASSWGAILVGVLLVILGLVVVPLLSLTANTHLGFLENLGLFLVGAGAVLIGAGTSREVVAARHKATE